MSIHLERLLSRGIAFLADGKAIEHYMGQEDVQGLPSAEQQELRELLNLSAGLLRLRQVAVPAPKARAANRARFLGEAVQRKEAERRPAAPRRMRVPGRLQRGLMGLVLSLALLVVAGGSVVSAAAGSLPGSRLYPLKLTVEDARVSLATSPPARARLYIRFADQRTTEMVRLAEAGLAANAQVITRLSRQLQGALDAAVASGGDAQRLLLQQMIEASRAQRERLTGASAEAPPEVQDALGAGAATVEQASRQAEEALQGLEPVAATATPDPTDTAMAEPTQAPGGVPVDTPTATSRPTTATRITPTGTMSATLEPTGTGIVLATPTRTPGPSTTTWPTPTGTTGLTPTLSATPGPGTATPSPTGDTEPTPTVSSTPQPTATPQAVFRLTNEDTPDPVPASYRIHYAICVVNDGDVPLTNVVIRDTWSPQDCVYLPPDNAPEFSWDIGTVDARTRQCVSLTLSTYSICGGGTVTNVATMSCDQGSAQAVQYTRIAGTPTPTAEPTTAATPTEVPTATLAGTPTLTPAATMTPTSTSKPAASVTPTENPEPTLTPASSAARIAIDGRAGFALHIDTLWGLNVAATGMTALRRKRPNRASDY
ncbi:MAG: hypothetical protein JSW37_03835 [Anaerolineales bacterium]|nr:MAG: hypothetical protein JSW37_03835 [Anaerolineales bacterium]